MGYSRAGFHVIGVDIKPQPNYPFTFVQADALGFEIPEWVDMVHASPPCQLYSRTSKMGHDLSKYPDHLDPIREKLKESGKPYVIENVVGAPMIDPITLHGDMFGLQVIRHRLFESNVFLMAPYAKVVTNAGTGTDNNTMYSTFEKGMRKIGVYGKAWKFEDGCKAMGIDWMKTHKELAESIPPAYTKFIGGQILDYLTRAKAA